MIGQDGRGLAMGTKNRENRTMQVFQALVLLLSLACASYSGASEDLGGRKLLQTRRGKPSVDDVDDSSGADDQSVNDYGDLGSSQRRSSPISDTPVSDSSSRRDVGLEGSLSPPTYVDRRGGGSAPSPPPLEKKESEKALSPPPAEEVDNPFLDSDFYSTVDLEDFEPEPLLPNVEEVFQDQAEPFKVLGAGLCRGQDVTGGPALSNHYTVDSGVTAKQCQDACLASGSCIGYAWGIINFCEVYFSGLCENVHPLYGAGCSTGFHVKEITKLADFGDPFVICFTRNPDYAGTLFTGGSGGSSTETTDPYEYDEEYGRGNNLPPLSIPDSDYEHAPRQVMIHNAPKGTTHSDSDSEYAIDSDLSYSPEKNTGQNTAVFVSTVFIFFLMFGFAFYVAIAVIRRKGAAQGGYNDVDMKNSGPAATVPGLDQSYHELNDDFVFEEESGDTLLAPPGQPQSQTRIHDHL
ncbi:hypothetical protein CYMTET_29957 [Cymbomonas tetramitiformis]|uniref:Apple domain-containing protein n=1 Tax=Cymbomonas tetramitiformis TaxID=36881 RepID=A0AAE0KUE0_9CHLO|nr:hypothetical protein CYMTET_29957 [Cymbomonas tetramitiformis]